jgi:hypothetical protein
MKPFYFAAVLVVLIAGCASNSQPTRSGPADTDSYILHSPDGTTQNRSTSKPPRLSVGTSYSDTQLILPWFLNDIINFVNYR